MIEAFFYEWTEQLSKGARTMETSFTDPNQTYMLNTLVGPKHKNGETRSRPLNWVGIKFEDFDNTRYKVFWKILKSIRISIKFYVFWWYRFWGINHLLMGVGGRRRSRFLAENDFSWKHFCDLYECKSNFSLILKAGRVRVLLFEIFGKNGCVCQTLAKLQACLRKQEIDLKYYFLRRPTCPSSLGSSDLRRCRHLSSGRPSLGGRCSCLQNALWEVSFVFSTLLHPSVHAFIQMHSRSALLQDRPASHPSAPIDFSQSSNHSHGPGPHYRQWDYGSVAQQSFCHFQCSASCKLGIYFFAFPFLFCYSLTRYNWEKLIDLISFFSKVALE